MRGSGSAGELGTLASRICKCYAQHKSQQVARQRSRRVARVQEVGKILEPLRLVVPFPHFFMPFFEYNFGAFLE